MRDLKEGQERSLKKVLKRVCWIVRCKWRKKSV